MSCIALRRGMLSVVLLPGALALAAGSSASAAETQPAEAKAAPAHQVIACYFHRTVRCPTCKKIGGYIEESVAAGFASQVQDGSVKLTMIDFQDPKNEKFTQAYTITGPTLVIMDVRDGKVTAWKTAPRVWSLVGDKERFSRYVQDAIRAYHEGTAALQ